MDNFLFGTILIKRTSLRDLPVNVQIWSYLMVFAPMLCIPAYAIYKLYITPGKTFDEVRAMPCYWTDETSYFMCFSVFNEQLSQRSPCLISSVHDQSENNNKKKLTLSNYWLHCRIYLSVVCKEKPFVTISLLSISKLHISYKCSNHNVFVHLLLTTIHKLFYFVIVDVC